MKNAYANKISYFILTFVFLIIIASFLFSNFDKFTMGGTVGKSVATVDGTPISAREYQMALNRQIEFFNQMMGGNGGLTQQQLEQMGIKQSVLNGLIQQKLILNAATDIGLTVSLDEVKSEIRNMSYFQTNGQFDVNLYRNMLQRNGYIPAQFEELVGNDLKQKKIEELFSTVIASEKAVQDLARFKGQGVVVEGVKISRQSLSPLVSVSEQEIKEYTDKPENMKNLENAYTENISKYKKAEEVKARHILIRAEDPKALDKIKAIQARVNTKNFADIAKKESEDPTGKSNGGDLGWFSAGRMVPEFEAVAFKMNKGTISEPVKTQFGYHLIYVEDKKAAESKSLESVKKELAIMSIQKTKAQDLDQLMKSEQERLEGLLKAGNFAAAEATAKKVDGVVLKNTEVNLLEQNIQGQALSAGESDQIFSAQPGTVVNLGNPGTIYLVRVVSKKNSEEITPEKLKAEITSQEQSFSRKSREELIRVMNNKAKIVTNQTLL